MRGTPSSTQDREASLSSCAARNRQCDFECAVILGPLSHRDGIRRPVRTFCCVGFTRAVEERPPLYISNSSPYLQALTAKLLRVRPGILHTMVSPIGVVSLRRTLPNCRSKNDYHPTGHIKVRWRSAVLGQHRTRKTVRLQVLFILHPSTSKWNLSTMPLLCSSGRMPRTNPPFDVIARLLKIGIFLKAKRHGKSRAPRCVQTLGASK